jgi:hypothetical protein
MSWRSIICPKCQTEWEIQVSKSNPKKKITCPECERSFVLPSESSKKRTPIWLWLMIIPVSLGMVLGVVILLNGNQQPEEEKAPVQIIGNQQPDPEKATIKEIASTPSPNPQTNPPQKGVAKGDPFEEPLIPPPANPLPVKMVYLEAPEYPQELTPQHLQPSVLNRELIRQAFLLAARDSMNLSTRDGHLRESVPEDLPQANQFKLEWVKPRPTILLSQGSEEDFKELWKKFIPIDGIVIQEYYPVMEMAEKMRAFIL